MLPLTPQQKLSQNKIAGLSIAWGRAAWAQLEDGTYGYVFKDGSLQLASTLADFEEKGLTLDALMACLDQFEGELGSALDTRQRYGMLKNHGYACPGLVVRSEEDDRVVCVMTPSSWEVDTTEAYFEWFFDEKYTTMSTFDTMAGVDIELAAASAADAMTAVVDVPYYEDACHKLAGLETVTESVKTRFLQGVWDYHKNLMPGLKPAAKTKLVAEWKSFLKLANLCEGRVPPSDDEVSAEWLADYLSNTVDNDDREENEIIAEIASTTGMPHSKARKILTAWFALNAIKRGRMDAGEWLEKEFGMAGPMGEQFSKQGEGCKNYDKEQDVCLDKDMAEPVEEEDEEVVEAHGGDRSQMKDISTKYKGKKIEARVNGSGWTDVTVDGEDVHYSKIGNSYPKEAVAIVKEMIDDGEFDEDEAGLGESIKKKPAA